MKKTLLLSALTLCAGLIFAQKTVTVDYTAKQNVSQKFGLTTTDGAFQMSVFYDATTLKFSTEKGQPPIVYKVAKKTDKYVIGSNEEGNYAFYDMKKKQFYYIDYFMSRYSTAGFGNPYSDVKQTALKMMDKLKEGLSQKEVVQFLVSQAEMDF